MTNTKKHTWGGDPRVQKGEHVKSDDFCAQKTETWKKELRTYLRAELQRNLGATKSAQKGWNYVHRTVHSDAKDYYAQKRRHPRESFVHIKLQSRSSGSVYRNIYTWGKIDMYIKVHAWVRGLHAQKIQCTLHPHMDPCRKEKLPNERTLRSSTPSVSTDGHTADWVSLLVFGAIDSRLLTILCTVSSASLFAHTWLDRHTWNLSEYKLPQKRI